ncbi:MAG: DUF6932 family protein [Emticicia sp.]
MEFDNFGNLHPYGIIKAELNIIEELFVTSFAESITRETLFGDFHLFLNEIKIIVENGTLWLDGSFVTLKKDPRDIDILIFVRSEILLEKERELTILKKKYQPKIDSYFIELLPENHPKYFLFEMNRKEWLFTFSTSRSF